MSERQKSLKTVLEISGDHTNSHIQHVSLLVGGFFHMLQQIESFQKTTEFTCSFVELLVWFLKSPALKRCSESVISKQLSEVVNKI